MLKLLKRWLGWEADDDFYGRANIQARARPSSATAHLFTKSPQDAPPRPAASPRARQPAKPQARPKPAANPTARPGARPQPASNAAARPAPKPSPRPRPPPAAAQNPRAAKPGAAPKRQSTDAPAQFDPYNTGKFDRSASWERISKNQR